MVDPIRVENVFQELIFQLETTDSIRYRYRLFRDFLSELNGEYAKYGTYIIQIAEEIPVYSMPLNWSGLDPSEIEAYIDLFETIEEALQLSDEEKVFQRMIIRMREVCILLYCYLNEYSKANQHLSSLCGFQFLLDQSGKKSESLISVFQDWLDDAISKNHKFTTGVRNTLQRLNEQVRFIQEVSYGKVLIPVSEIYEQPETAGVHYGRLRVMIVEIYGSAVTEDQVIQNFRMFGAERPISHQKKTALTAARRLFNTHIPQAEGFYFKGGISFEISGAIHDGDSANFALASLWYSRLSEATDQRRRFEVNPHAAITGDIDEKGNILEVDEETISLKVKAAFFSWAKQLVVPYKQRELFEKELADLRDKYPYRKLDLVGINYLKELFFDRRLAINKEQPLLAYYFKRARSQKYRVVTIPLIILLLAIIGRLIFGPVDQNSVAAEFSGSHMLLKNQYGQQIQSVEVGSEVVKFVERESNNNRRNKVEFYDLNSDKIDEVFYARNLNDANETSEEELVAYSTSGDSIIWTKTLRFDLSFNEKPNIGNDPFRVFNIKTFNQSQETSLIVNAAHHNLFPSILLQIDPETGKEISRYVHIGRIAQILSEDIDEDGVDEVIGLGQNNAFDQSTIVFQLEADDINGYSPTTNEYMPEFYETSSEDVYIRLPQSIVGKTFRYNVFNNRPNYIQIDNNEQSIKVRVYDFDLHDPNPFELNHGGLIFNFNYDFKIQSIGTDSNYDLWAENLYEDGRIPFEPNHEYFESFKDSLLYWNGDEFIQRNASSSEINHP